MKVNKNSWHYKILTERFCFMEGWYECYISGSLCLYFWQVMFRLFLGVGLGLLVVSPLFSWTIILLGLDPSVLGATGVLVLIMGLTATSAAIYIGMEFIVSKEKEPNLVVEYIKSKKNKVCPIIEFVEKD